jgi:DNA repair exonuclease SbcCD ATPase subunit
MSQHKGKQMAAIFDKSRKAQHKELVGRLTEASAAIEAAVSELNEAIGKFNEALDDARALRDEVAGDIQDYIDDKSERWQEGDTGREWSAWKDAIEGIDLDDVDEVDVDVPDVDPFETMPMTHDEA